MKRLTAIAAMLLSTGCTFTLPDIPIPGIEAPGAAPFLLTGTFRTILTEDAPPCRVWEGDNSITYHLFQNPDLNSDLFDQATSEGARSRLLIQLRGDLEVGCDMGPIAEVLEVREVFPRS